MEKKGWRETKKERKEDKSLYLSTLRDRNFLPSSSESQFSSPIYKKPNSSVVRSVGPSASQSVDGMVGQSVGRSVGRFVDWLVSRWIGRSVGRSVSLLVDKSAVRSVGSSVL